MTDESNPVVDVAKQQDDDDIILLSTGIRARLLPVSVALISEVTARVKDPDVPMWFNKNKGVEEPNPSDPSYSRALERAAQERGIVAMDAMAMFGVELVDGMPEDNGWVTKLHLLGITFDADDLVTREFHYKKHIAVGTADWAQISMLSGVNQEDIATARRNFRSDEGPDTDR